MNVHLQSHAVNFSPPKKIPPDFCKFLETFSDVKHVKNKVHLNFFPVVLGFYEVNFSISHILLWFSSPATTSGVHEVILGGFDHSVTIRKDFPSWPKKVVRNPPKSPTKNFGPKSRPWGGVYGEGLHSLRFLC